jgi:hypothetical protein
MEMDCGVTALVATVETGLPFMATAAAADPANRSGKKSEVAGGGP